MNLLLVNVLLTIAWVAVSGTLSALNFAFGFVLGAAALSLIREQVGSVGYFRKIRQIVTLIVQFIYELLMSAFRVAFMVMKPDMKLKPGIFIYDLTVKSDSEITLLANLITLTPGTLSVDVSEDKTKLYIHALECDNPEQTSADIRNGFERQIAEVFSQ